MGGRGRPRRAAVTPCQVCLCAHPAGPGGGPSEESGRFDLGIPGIVPIPLSTAAGIPSDPAPQIPSPPSPKHFCADRNPMRSCLRGTVVGDPGAAFSCPCASLLAPRGPCASDPARRAFALHSDRGLSLESAATPLSAGFTPCFVATR